MKNENNTEKNDIYVTLGGDGTFEFTVERSTFIGYAKRVTSEPEALGFLGEIRKKHSDAKHNVFAYVLKEHNIMRHSDDGEPAGTAGKPVLDYILKTGFTDAVIVVTRYFGGILLGKGGLVRAYTTAAKGAAENAGIVSYAEYTEFEIECDYPEYEKIKYESRFFGLIEDFSEFGGRVKLKYAVKTPLFSGFEKKLSEIGSGKIRAIVTGKRYDVF